MLAVIPEVAPDPLLVPDPALDLDPDPGLIIQGSDGDALTPGLETDPGTDLRLITEEIQLGIAHPLEIPGSGVLSHSLDTKVTTGMLVLLRVLGSCLQNVIVCLFK